MSANKFKVGDKVKVRNGLVVDKFYGNVRCNSSMAKMGGEVLTICRIVSDYYKFEENTFAWTDEMLEPVEPVEPAEKTLDNLCVGDFVGLENIKRKVLAVVDGCYLLSDIDNYMSVGCWYTSYDLRDLNCVIIELDAPEPTVEIDGKKYKKADVERAIKDLESIE